MINNIKKNIYKIIIILLLLLFVFVLYFIIVKNIKKKETFKNANQICENIIKRNEDPIKIQECLNIKEEEIEINYIPGEIKNVNIKGLQGDKGEDIPPIIFRTKNDDESWNILANYEPSSESAKSLETIYYAIPRGLEGATGKPGKEGNEGPTGKPGRDGVIGECNYNWSIGRTGDEGEKGDVGPDGFQGEPGRRPINGRDGINYQNGSPLPGYDIGMINFINYDNEDEILGNSPNTNNGNSPITNIKLKTNIIPNNDLYIDEINTEGNNSLNIESDLDINGNTIISTDNKDIYTPYIIFNNKSNGSSAKIEYNDNKLLINNDNNNKGVYINKLNFNDNLCLDNICITKENLNKLNTLVKPLININSNLLEKIIKSKKINNYMIHKCN